MEALEQAGGTATRAWLLQATSRAEVDRAVGAGDVVVLARGRYALRVVDDAVHEAHRLSATVSHLSAAMAHGWEVLVAPSRAHVTVRRNRTLVDPVVFLHWADLPRSEVGHGVTSEDRTLLDCCRSLPFAEALAVADSALRHGYDPERLQALGDRARGPGSRQVRRVAECATAEAANPFESALRAVALDVAGLALRPQVEVRDPHFIGRVDLADERMRVALEADSWTWHGNRLAFERDCRRYNALVAHGWLVLRFTYDDVVRNPAEVAATLEAVVAERAQRLCQRCRPA